MLLALLETSQEGVGEIILQSQALRKEAVLKEVKNEIKCKKWEHNFLCSHFQSFN